MGVKRSTLIQHIDTLLQPQQYKDYCPNGLQVQGIEQIQTIISGVTANQALIELAIECQTDALLVHHGYFWKNEDPCITGMKRQRLALLLAHNINLLAYHLPLDSHPELGNNAQLAKRLGIKITGPLQPNAPYTIGHCGEWPDALTIEQLSSHIDQQLNRKPLIIKAHEKPTKTIAWCTGAGQGYIEQAARLGVDAYLSGEISESTVHAAREWGLHYIAAGHHATERYGVQALGEHLAQQFGLDHQFIDIANPA